MDLGRVLGVAAQARSSSSHRLARRSPAAGPRGRADLRPRPTRGVVRRDRDRVRGVRGEGSVGPAGARVRLPGQLLEVPAAGAGDRPPGDRATTRAGWGCRGCRGVPGYRARNVSSEDFSLANHARDMAAVLDDAGATSGRADRSFDGRADDPGVLSAVPGADVVAGVADRALREPAADVLRPRLHERVPGGGPGAEAVPAAGGAAVAEPAARRTRGSRTRRRSSHGRSGRSRSRRTWRPTTGTWASSTRW